MSGATGIASACEAAVATRMAARVSLSQKPLVNYLTCGDPRRAALDVPTCHRDCLDVTAFVSPSTAGRQSERGEIIHVRNNSLGDSLMYKSTDTNRIVILRPSVLRIRLHSLPAVSLSGFLDTLLDFVEVVTFYHDGIDRVSSPRRGRLVHQRFGNTQTHGYLDRLR